MISNFHIFSQKLYYQVHVQIQIYQNSLCYSSLYTLYLYLTLTETETLTSAVQRATATGTGIDLKS